MNDLVGELQVIREIVGDLSGVGIWLVVAYMFYKFVFLSAALYGMKFIVSSVFDYLKPSITKSEAEDIQRKNKDLVHEISVSASQHKQEIERYKHAYKILKEKAEFEGENLSDKGGE